MRTRSSSPLLILCYVLVFVLILLAIGEWILRSRVSEFTNAQKKNSEQGPESFLLSANGVSFVTEDRANLSGWLIQGKLGYPAVVIAHNYGSNRSETLGNLENLISGLNKLGYFVLLFDFRGHGDSTSRSALGLKEATDMQAALKATLKYRQIEKRLGVLGVGMGALAAAQACEKLDQVKIVILDSIYEDVSERVTKTIVEEVPATRYIRRALLYSVDWNLRSILDVPSTKTDLARRLARLYPKAVIFVEHKPLRPEVKALYDATKEPKELMQFDETATGTLIGDVRQEYSTSLLEKIHQYLPPVSSEPTIELKE